MRVTCPKCGFTFDTSYSRITACSGCELSVLGDCGYVKCPNCGYEFEYDETRRKIRSCCG